MANLAVDGREEVGYEFYKKYLWKELSTQGEQESGLVLRTIFFQFGNWCVKRKYTIGGNNATKLFWF